MNIQPRTVIDRANTGIWLVLLTAGSLLAGATSAFAATDTTTPTPDPNAGTTGTINIVANCKYSNVVAVKLQDILGGLLGLLPWIAGGLALVFAVLFMVTSGSQTGRGKWVKGLLGVFAGLFVVSVLFSAIAIFAPTTCAATTPAG